MMTSLSTNIHLNKLFLSCIFWEEAEMCFCAKRPLHVFISSLSVCGLGRDFSCDTERLLLQRKRVTARRTGTLAVCWGLFVSVAIATVRLRWQRRGGSSGCYVIHGLRGRPSRAKVWQPSRERTREEASGGSAQTQAGLSCSSCYPQCTSRSQA